MRKCTPTRRHKCVRSWLESVRNRSTTRGSACCPVAWQALQGPRILQWVGQRSRATIDQKMENITCKTDNFVPLVVPGLSVNSGSSSSCTAPPQEQLGPDAHQVSGNRASSSSSSGSVLEPRDELATRRLEQEPWDDKKDSDDPLADLRFWFEDFTDNLEPTEEDAPAHISRDSDSEHPTKVVTKPRKRSIYSLFPKDRNFDVCLRTKITKASCWRRTGEAVLRAEKFGDLITADHKVLNEGGESRDYHRYAVVVQDLATQWIQSYPCKTKSSHETDKQINSWSRRKHRKLYIQTTRWNLGEHVKFIM